MTTAQEKEVKLLHSAVDKFAIKMKARLADKVAQGYSGWEGAYPLIDLCQEIRDDARNVSNYDADENASIDIATRAMMLWWRFLNEKEVKAK